MNLLQWDVFSLEPTFYVISSYELFCFHFVVRNPERIIKSHMILKKCFLDF